MIPVARAGRGTWIGPSAHPLAARVWEPPDGGSGAGVLLLPPVGYEYWTSHQTVRALAERLAGGGHLVLRLDYEGTGDSSGEQDEPGRWSAWLSAVDHGVAQLRRWGAEQVAVVGVRLGGTLALLRGAELALAAVVAVHPVLSGRRYTRRLALLGSGLEVPESVEPGTVYQAGTVFPPDLIADLSAVDLSRLGSRPAARALVLDPQEQPAAEGFVQRLRELGCDARHAAVGGLEEVLERPAEEAEVGEAVIDAVAGWLGHGPPGAARPPALRERVRIPWRGGEVQEEWVRIGRPGLAGVMTTPAGVEPAATLVLLNSGSEVHVGPGRAWVEYARGVARAGFAALRVDFRGWGDSPDDAHTPGRPYDRHTWDDTLEIVADLRRRGHRRVVVAGLCAGAWVALKAATLTDLDGVVAINPQLYWQPGDPVEALISTTRQRRLPEIEHFRREGAELERTQRHPAADWLVELRERATPVLTLFARGDDGLEFLADRLPQEWHRTLGSGVVRLAEVDIDHPMHRHWRRDAVIEALLGFLGELVEQTGDDPRCLEVDRVAGAGNDGDASGG
jgi:dienelactone hydrolase